MRQTGRTTRMLEHAAQLAKQGRAVYIIAADARETSRIQKLVPRDLGIKVENAQQNRTFDWDSVTLLGAHSNCQVLVDHYAAEQKCKSIEQEILRLQLLLARTRSLARCYDIEGRKS